MARARETVFAVTNRCYEAYTFLSLLNKVQYCAAECVEKIADLDNILPERYHYPSRIVEPVLTHSHFTTSSRKNIAKTGV